MKLRKQMGYKKNHKSDVITFTERMMNTEAGLIKKYTGKNFNFGLFWKKAVEDADFWGWHMRMTTIVMVLDSYEDKIQNIFLDKDGFLSQVATTAIETGEGFEDFQNLISGIWKMSIEQIMGLSDKYFRIKKVA